MSDSILIAALLNMENFLQLVKLLSRNSNASVKLQNSYSKFTFLCLETTTKLPKFPLILKNKSKFPKTSFNRNLVSH